MEANAFSIQFNLFCFLSAKSRLLPLHISVIYISFVSLFNLPTKRKIARTCLPLQFQKERENAEKKNQRMVSSRSQLTKTRKKNIKTFMLINKLFGNEEQKKTGK